MAGTERSVSGKGGQECGAGSGLAQAVIAVRRQAGLTQQELAEKMGTTQPVIARLESGHAQPSMRTLERLAKATGSRLVVRFEMLEEHSGT